ncbi:MAG: UDP-N-acetylmuramoyl-L-alanine--D-glutamate ligase [Oscillospiraceae bacterium]|nr:UDP-N-acetylmuramoyl-L-alanine--D-glutamate ligase [Oscillospiraceae bacterium]
MLPKIIEFLKDKKILILGFGREGRSSFDYIRKYLSEKEITVADGKEQALPDKFTKGIFGEDYLSHLGDFEVVLKSPGIPFRDVEIPENVLITCQLDLFLQYAPCKKLGVTGSKGKTTTSTLAYKMLVESGVDAVLMGNMGLPVLDYIEEIEGKIAVIEMSSHQLEFTRHSPDVAIITNIYEEHLEHYKGGMKGYVGAKLNIVKHQNENNTFVYNGTQGLSEYIDLNSIKSKKIAVNEDDEIPFKAENPHLIGIHNKHDILLAFNGAKELGATAQGAEKAIADFEGIEHRMECVGTYKGVTFYNDCIATIPHAVMCASVALGAKTLIFGGMDRGIDYTDFARDLENSQLSVLIGTKTTGHKIIDMMNCNGTAKVLLKAENIEDAVIKAYENTEKGGICILSPAAPSYNEYKNFEEKGRFYKTCVRKYGE